MTGLQQAPILGSHTGSGSGGLRDDTEMKKQSWEGKYLAQLLSQVEVKLGLRTQVSQGLAQGSLSDVTLPGSLERAQGI